MKKNALPALGIILVTITLLIINEYLAWTWISDYALILIIAGTFLGVWLAKRWWTPKMSERMPTAAEPPGSPIQYHSDVFF